MFQLDRAVEEWRRQMLAAGVKTPETLNELETHLREAIERQIKAGLDEREGFYSAVQNIGPALALGSEFKKVGGTGIYDMKTMKMFIHACILLIFGFGCLFVWGILELVPEVSRSLPQPPAFTQFCCVSLRPVLIIMPLLAAVYCLWVGFLKVDRVPSWVGFFAATTGVLVLVTLPALVAAYLPLVSAVNHLAGK